MKTEKLTYLGLGPHHFDLKNPLLMGVANVTPDSFSDGGSFSNGAAAIARAVQLFESGADIIDVGGESTRPGAKPVPSHEERTRVIPVVRELVKMGIPTSVDTMKPEIMEEAADIGACLINDISGLEHDVKTVELLKKTKIPFVIHHIQGNPATMQKNPKYKNVILDIYDFFENKIKYLRSMGIKHNNIILDPGIGFGKNLKHNITLLRKISIFHSLGFPVMLGTSRKRFIKDLSGENDSKERLGGTIASNLFAIMQGVQILRVHDVNEVNQSIKVFKSLKF